MAQFGKRRCQGRKVGFISFNAVSDDFEVRRGAFGSFLGADTVNYRVPQWLKRINHGRANWTVKLLVTRLTELKRGAFSAN